MQTQGIIVGSNDKTAWLLPWWWHWYSMHNTFPVTFVDFGLSKNHREFCQEKGTLLSLPKGPKITPKERISQDLQKKWEKAYGNSVWDARLGWFYKPLAFCASPYDIAIWIDLDCEVCGNLSPLFSILEQDAEMAIAKDPGREGIYNSGVVVFRKQSTLITQWIQKCTKENHLHCGDDHILSTLLHESTLKWNILPSSYHHMAGMGFSPSALIIHFASNWGKLFIETQGGYQALKYKAQNGLLSR